MDSNRHKEQMRYLSQSVRLRETSSPEVVRGTIMAISLSVIAFTAWAACAPVHEIARTPGEVIPSGYEQVVQHLDGGMVGEILAHENNTVSKGQVLLRIDGGEARGNLDQLQTQHAALGLKEERLRAFIEGRAADFSGRNASPALVRDAEAFFASTVLARRKEREIVEQQVGQKTHEIGALSATLATARSNESISADLLHRQRELNRQGYLPDIRLMETEQQYNQVAGQVSILQNQIAQARAALGEYTSRLSSMSADQSDEAHRQLDAVMADTAQNKEQIDKLQMQIGRLDIRAPVDGIVKGLAVNTVGSVVQPGQVLMQIVPLKDSLVVALKIPPRYIGHLHPGQAVQLKFSSYDFARYGSVPGSLASISATTFTGADGERYYHGKVFLDSNHVGSSDNKVLPGMTVMADIITGDKTILSYLLKPVQRAVSTAFTER